MVKVYHETICVTERSIQGGEKKLCARKSVPSCLQPMIVQTCYDQGIVHWWPHCSFLAPVGKISSLVLLPGGFEMDVWQFVMSIIFFTRSCGTLDTSLPVYPPFLMAIFCFDTFE